MLDCNVVAAKVNALLNVGATITRDAVDFASPKWARIGPAHRREAHTAVGARADRRRGIDRSLSWIGASSAPSSVRYGPQKLQTKSYASAQIGNRNSRLTEQSPTHHHVSVMPTATTPEASPSASSRVALDIRNFNFFYDTFQALEGISLRVSERRITAMIGACLIRACLIRTHAKAARCLELLDTHGSCSAAVLR